jgi:two-component system cell cycle response regulator CpdR
VAEPADSRRILLAEDDENVRRLNANALIDSGYQVDAAVDGAVAWDSLQTKTYRLLITDHHMPRMSGLDLIKKMRASSMTLPVILVSGKMPAEALESNSWLQISAMLPKPYVVEDLLRIVNEVM